MSPVVTDDVSISELHLTQRFTIIISPLLNRSDITMITLHYLRCTLNILGLGVFRRF